MWAQIARRIVQGLDVQPGELVQVRDHAGRFDVLKEVLLAVELAGATPLPEITPADYLGHLWERATPDYLAHWDRHRREWMAEIDRIIALAGAEFDPVPRDGFDAWRQATFRLTTIEEERRLPFILVAIPTEMRARQLGENRYMGGQNASSLNVDFALPGATLLADGRVIVAGGKGVIESA